MTELNESLLWESRLPDCQSIRCSSLTVVNSQSPWTAARCHRLLRPLSSRLALLRKELQLDIRQSEQYTDRVRTRDHKLGLFDESVRDREKYRKGLAINTVADPAAEWEPNPRPRKKMKRTYSSKDRALLSEEASSQQSESQKDAQSSNIIIDLPPQLSVVAKIPESLAIKDTSSQLSRSTYIEINPPQDLPQSSALSNWKLIDGICKGFIALLRASAARERRSRTGCRSLLSTCVRRVPVYIAQEEMILREEDPDNDVDISNAIYNDLEELGSMPESGWEPFRVLVRSHGLNLITSAIKEGLLELSVARHLLHLCLDISAYDEALAIIESLIDVATVDSKLVSKSAKRLPYDLHMIVNGLSTLVSRYGMEGVSYWYTAAMLESCLLPTQWICSKPMIGTWNGVIRSITQEDENSQSAVMLLQVAAAASYRIRFSSQSKNVHDLRLLVRKTNHRPKLRFARSDQSTISTASIQPGKDTVGSRESKVDSDVRSTLSTIFAVLTAISLLRNGASSLTLDDSSGVIRRILQDLAIEARGALDLELQTTGPHGLEDTCPESLWLPLLAAGLAAIPSPEALEEISGDQLLPLNTLANLLPSNEGLSKLGFFVSSVVRCRARASSEDPFTVLKNIVQDLTVISKTLHLDESLRKFCSRLALASAFAFSEETGRPHHIDWALQVEVDLMGRGNSTPKPAIVKTPVRGDKKSNNGFRWEESICEWIAKTPNLVLPKPACMEPTVPRVENVRKAWGNNIEEKLNDPSQKPACFKEVEKSGNGAKGEERALHVLIHTETKGSESEVRSKEPSQNITCKPGQKPSRQRSFQSIHEDEIDELSTPELSQPEPSVLSIMKEPPNVANGAKRKRGSRLKQRQTNSNALSHAPSKEECSTFNPTDTDELGHLFHW